MSTTTKIDELQRKFERYKKRGEQIKGSLRIINKQLKELNVNADNAEQTLITLEEQNEKLTTELEKITNQIKQLFKERKDKKK